MGMTPTEQVKILIIDDNQDDRLLCRRALQKSTETRYELLEAGDGEYGMRIIEEEQPVCVLLDYSLPGRNGIEVLKRIRAKHPFIPVVILTGQGNEKVAVTAIQQGAQNYIVKSSITQEILEHTTRMSIDHCTLQKRSHEQRTSLAVFTRALAHDLKEPARTIRSYIELLGQQNELNGKSKNYFNYIQNASDRMLTLIDTVFLYTQLNNTGDVTKEICNLSTILVEVQENLDQLIRERGATITSTSMPVIYANRAHIMQLMQNLICNAIYHSEKPVSIHIRSAAQADYWLLTVRDNGAGIEEEYQKTIFEPFKRMTSTEEQGAGLGLAICEKIVESHSGKIWCESHPGQGSTFFFSLPRTLPVSEQPPAMHSSDFLTAREPSARENKPLANVLLVDDSRADIEMTRFKLLEHSRLQCNLLTATHSSEALTILRTGMSSGQPIDLLLLDINMPGMDGFELLQQIRADKELHRITIVMCTNSIYDKDMQRARELGAAGYLTKPLDFTRLKSIIAQNMYLRLSQENEGYSLWRAA